LRGWERLETRKKKWRNPSGLCVGGINAFEYIKEDFEPGFEPSRAIENKSAHGELVEPLERLELAAI